MKREELSKNQLRAFHRALEPVFLTRFPNPERKDCPGTATLRSIAQKTLSIHDPAIDHVGSCSPCFNELQQIRTGIRKHRVLWVAATATASILIAALLLGYGVFRTPAGDGSITKQQAELLDLRNVSAVRGESALPTPNVDTLQLRRSPLQLTIQLPVGSEEGPYTVKIQRDEQSPLATTNGAAKIENQVTTLHIEIDTSQIPPGEYRLAIRHADFNWRYYPLTLR
jgi:hypothetical protein